MVGGIVRLSEGENVPSFVSIYFSSIRDAPIQSHVENEDVSGKSKVSLTPVSSCVLVPRPR